MNTLGQTRIRINGDISIVIAGAAGQGIQAIEYVLSRILRSISYNVFSTSEFMSRIRGGCNSTLLRVSAKKNSAYINRIDIFIPLDSAAFKHCKNRITNKTIILGDSDSLESEYNIVNIPFTKIATEIGGKIYANSVAVGVVCGMLGIEETKVKQYLEMHFSEKSADIIVKNIAASGQGFLLGAKLLADGLLTVNIDKDPTVANEFFMTGAEAVALGALAGGCDFVSSYPMSPSTNVLQFLAEHKNEFGIVVEQAEDEISAINMAIGAWYAGGRGFVTTAGGGFALMGEGVSLAGMLETPVVVNVGQRPGPATGLPTRTEQGDLDLVLYSGHGDFPRAIYAPGTIDGAYNAVRKAFEVADKYQIPSFILTDQYFLDSSWASPPFQNPSQPDVKNIVETVADYKRYAFSENGVSPRGIPGKGEGIVCVDSDEHTEEGYITESMDVREKMVRKRMKKLELLENDILVPKYLGPENLRFLVVCWGSNYTCVKEAVNLIGDSRLAMMHVTQIYPLHLTIKFRMSKAQKVIVVENNATGQFAKLMTRETGLPVHQTILKYDGMPFSVEELVEKISAAIA